MSEFLSEALEKLKKGVVATAITAQPRYINRQAWCRGKE